MKGEDKPCSDDKDKSMNKCKVKNKTKVRKTSKLIGEYHQEEKYKRLKYDLLCSLVPKNNDFIFLTDTENTK